MHPDRATDIYVADTIGELGLFYRLSPVVLMGGSLVPHGGQNPIEPAKLGARHPARAARPQLHRSLCGARRRPRGARGRRLACAGARASASSCRIPALTREMARAAGDAVQALGGAVERTLQSIEPFIVQVKLGARL